MSVFYSKCAMDDGKSVNVSQDIQQHRGESHDRGGGVMAREQGEGVWKQRHSKL